MVFVVDSEKFCELLWKKFSPEFTNDLLWELIDGGAFSELKKVKVSKNAVD